METYNYTKKVKRYQNTLFLVCSSLATSNRNLQLPGSSEHFRLYDTHLHCTATYMKCILYVSVNGNVYLRGRKDLCPEEEEEGAVVEVAGALSTGPGLAALGLGRSWQELVQAHAAGSLEGPI